MTEAALSVRNLSKRFGELAVTNDVSFELERGARHALIGPNGAGKSTLVHQLSGVLKPDAGSVVLQGIDVTSMSARDRVALGLGRTFQISNLFFKLTVFENIFMALSERAGISGKPWLIASRQKALIEEGEEIAATFGLDGCMAQTVSEVSYGEQRLLEIAIAMALRPKVLLLDEPAAGLPKSEISSVLNGLALLPAETAILLIEHDMHIVREFATTVALLVDGRLELSGTPREVLESELVRSVYLGARHSSGSRAHA
ncbi:ABC transporter ATP-binding protein [Roseiarcaceae bacterium H3SJ34-1]|uniref:ABC transporter ATP-binding protein n=1 Tax=Terripilifer ovatus TaxID=3032367 RepID=UPI003AB98F9E|nr:ABC transporter ATP-binding protein [Roseiarcaceae bacterium H3SJ34-1]